MTDRFERPVPAGVAPPVAPYAAVVVSGDTVYVSGQVAFDPDREVVGDDIRTQTRQTIANLERCLRAAGCELTDVTRIGAFLARRPDIGGFNEAYAEAFSAPYPARTTVVAGLSDRILVEIEAIAKVPPGPAPAGREDG
ncbi:MAG: RidA family protein [Actinobacteria bacterium]|nr:RidA family protein [Actinomycetota bacterium]